MKNLFCLEQSGINNLNKVNDNRSVTVYSDNNNTEYISSNKLLYYRVGDTIVNTSEIDVATVLAKTTELETRYSTFDSRLTYLEALIAKCYTSMD